MGVGWVNSEESRAAEVLSGNIHASAKGLAKIGTFMAQKGTAGGKRIMSEASWNEFHADKVTEVDYNLFGSEFTSVNGGVSTNFPSRPPGFYGWEGFGGSLFTWNPTHKLSIAYVPVDLNLEEG